ncbi:beta-propeller domain-containing protein [Paraglaciecola aquimarina]|uniref:Beta-propeller domain-containing protein n=1 Tax=Paraglaciecola aquimarina TaxID=1235557 RepID=A0ABU3SV78_9ALTE|nr:beta-propeller domain-containing protein [Paraglaciecola aquimarina]MDU0353891.1 beta-propeller domain-containing protein [Paraglaciecola aquimarina]
MQPVQKNIGNQLCLVVIVLIIFTLVACSSDDKNASTSGQQKPTEVPELNAATTFNGPLTKAGATSVSQFIKNGIYSATYEYSTNQRLEDSASPTVNDSDSAPGFSTTNTQEAGVDEADRLKYNGGTMFLAAHAEWQSDHYKPAHVRILERQNDFSLSETAEILVEEAFPEVAGIYQHNERLAILSNSIQMYRIDDFSPEPWIPHEEKWSLQIYDTSVPTTPVVSSQIEIDGTMLSSRRIGDNLFIVNGYTAAVNGLSPTASTDKELLDNYLTIINTPMSELMPKIYFDGADGVLLNQAADCSMPAAATDKDGYAHLLTVVRINLLDVSDYSASCISSVADVMYMSTDNLYLTASVNNQTVIHKVSLDENLSYQATGVVDGVIGWRSSPNLRLSEYDNHLRIMSSDYTSGEPVHRLSVLAQQGSQLNVVGQLPNDTSPEPIGKPGEDIYGVRFFADRGYVVTFERIDPLYVFDLSIPTAPQMLGELEIPGFSNYLHPLDNGYLLGVGQQVNIEDILENGSDAVAPVAQNGMKVSLFDITDPTQPLEVNSIVTPDSYTPVEYDYHALTVLNTNGRYQFALPIEKWGSNITGVATRRWSQNSLALLEVDTNAAQPELVKRAEIVAPINDEQYIYGGQDRSVIHGSTVYYIHGNQVWRSLWAENADIFGPY